jgi:uncharacterized SAM-binding protein YcdF (DUF218 family)
MNYFSNMKKRYSAPSPIDEEVLRLAKVLWNYHHMHHNIDKADCILALGSHDTRVADRAAELWLEKRAPYIVFSGGLGNLTSGMWSEPEADTFAKIAINLGVPNDAIYIENKSTNTGENVLFTQQLLAANGLDPEKLIVVQKPYMERRTYATVKRWWPSKELIITSPQLAFEKYPDGEITVEKVIHIMVGDLQRIRFYPEKGYQIYQEIPDDVWESYQRLVEIGYTDHLIKD